MFEFDAGKLIIIGIVALIVIGPKELPRVMLQLGQAAAKMRRMAADFRAQFMDAMREAEMEGVKSDVAKIAESVKSDAGIDHLAQIESELTRALEAPDKPATQIGDEKPMVVLPSEAKPSVDSETGSRLPKALVEEAQTTMAEPSAARATHAEMRALAEALAAEMGEASPLHPGKGGAASHGKV
jgi:sec-independent protein translocase protein TatB